EKLSGGQKQRLAVACALVSDPELLFLDEPTTGLDPQSRRQLWDVVLGFKSRGRTVLLTTHYMDEAERLCDRVAVVDRGKVIALGTPAELIASLGGQQVIEAQLDGAVADGELSALPGVHRLSRAGGTVSLAVEKLHQTLPDPVAVGVWSGPDASGSRRVVEALRGTNGIEVREYYGPSTRDLSTGKIALFVRPGERLEYDFDPTRPESRLAREIVDNALQRASGRADVLRTMDHPVAAPGSRYIDFLIPGLIGMNIMSGSMWGIGYVVVEMR